MSKNFRFAKISEPEMTAVRFDDHFRDRVGEVEKEHIEVFPKLLNCEMTRIPLLMASHTK